MTDEKEKQAEEPLKRWKECLDEIAGTEYDCSFDCGSRQGQDMGCYHGKLFAEEVEKAEKALGELLSASADREKALHAAEAECRNPERQGWASQRGLKIIEKLKR